MGSMCKLSFNKKLRSTYGEWQSFNQILFGNNFEENNLG